MEDGTVLVESYGWQQHLTSYFRPLPQIKQYQHFSFDALEPGVVVAKKCSDSVGTRFQLLRNADILPPIDGLPEQGPPGLDTARKTYIFEKIRVLRRRGYGHHMPCTKVKGRTEIGFPNIDSLVHCTDGPVHHWWRVLVHTVYYFLYIDTTYF